MEQRREPLIIRNARIFKPNFSGKEIPPYNPAGKRTFCVFIDDIKAAEDMEKDGWNVRWLQPRQEGDEKKAFISVEVKFAFRPPKIVIISSGGETYLDEEDVNMLDWAEKERVDLSINPRFWEDNGRTRIKAYLRTMKVWIYEDELEAEIDERYQNAPDGAKDVMVDEELPFE